MPRLTCRALAWGALFFLAGQLGLGLAIDRVGVAIRDPDYAAKEALLRARRAEAPGRPLVVALGSSRTLLGLDAARLSHNPDGPLVFNFGLAASGPLRMALTWRRLLAAGLRPDAVVIEVLPPVLTIRGQDEAEPEWDDGARLSAAELTDLWPCYRDPVRVVRQWMASRLLPCNRYVLQPAALGFPVDDYGWHAQHLPGLSPEWRAEFRARARRSYGGACRDGRIGPAVNALRTLLVDCQRENVRAVCVLMPEGSAFRRLYDEEALSAVLARVNDICRDTGARLLDARDWMADDLFWDTHHLLDTGAALFSDRLAAEAMPDLLRSAENPLAD